MTNFVDGLEELTFCKTTHLETVLGLDRFAAHIHASRSVRAPADVVLGHVPSRLSPGRGGSVCLDLREIRARDGLHAYLTPLASS